MEKQVKKGFYVIIRRYWGLLLLLLLVILSISGITLVLPLIISEGIDTFSNKNFSLQTILIRFLCAALAIMILNYIQRFLEVYISERVAKELRSSLSNKISQQDYDFIEKANPSKLLTNYVVDVNAIKSFVGETFTLILSSCLIIIGTSILLFHIHWKLAICITLLIPFISLAFLRILSKVKVLFEQSRSVIDRINKVIDENIKGALLIRVMNSQRLENGKFHEANSMAKNVGYSIHRIYLKVFPLFPFTENIALLFVLSLGGYFVAIDTLSLGYFNAFLCYSGLMLFNVIYVSSMVNDISDVFVSFKRVTSIGHMETSRKKYAEYDFQQKIEINDVSVILGGTPILKNISLTIEAGSTTIIVGPTAAGKTHLLYLLSGLLKPNTGSVKFDNSDITRHQDRLLSNLVGFVFQESIIFNLSMRENIAFSDSVANESLWKAIETAELMDFVQGLPLGLETVLSERGANLSGGQKQRLMLARALAVNPKILLLDDFVAHVDINTSEKILKNIYKNYPALTIVSVSQRITTLQNYDQTVFLMNGEIIDVGKHEDLFERSVDYRELFKSQQNLDNL